MRVLVVGGGGREHALAWKLARSPRVEALWCAPGNAGIADVATCVRLAAADLKGLARFAREERIDLGVDRGDGVLAGQKRRIEIGRHAGRESR